MFKQRNYCNINTLRLSRPVLFSANVQSDQVAVLKKCSNNDIIGTLTI